MKALITATTLLSMMLAGCGAYQPGLGAIAANTRVVAESAGTSDEGFREVARYEHVQDDVQQGVTRWLKGHPLTETFPSGKWPVGGFFISDLKVRADGGHGIEAVGDCEATAISHVYAVNSFGAAFHLRMNAQGQVTEFTYQKGRQDHTPAKPAPQFQALTGEDAASVMAYFKRILQQPNQDNVFYFMSNANTLSLLQDGSCSSSMPQDGFFEQDTLVGATPMRMSIADGEVVKRDIKWTATYKTGYSQTADCETTTFLIDANGRILETFPRNY